MLQVPSSMHCSANAFLGCSRTASQFPVLSGCGCREDREPAGRRCVSPGALPCHCTHCFDMGLPLPAETLSWPSSVAGAPLWLSSPGRACTQCRSRHNMAILTIPVLNRKEGSAPSARRPQLQLWDTITLTFVCQTVTFLGFPYPFLLQE